MIYLTLTTLPERLVSDHFKKVYISLKKQKIPFDKLIINLSVKQFTYVIPEYLKQDPNVIINETDICGPCAKLIGALDIIPNNSVVIVMDDDIVMRNNFIYVLYNSYLQNPNKVSSNFINIHPNFKEVCGFGGYIFNIDKLRNIKELHKTMPDCCIKIDDTWISWCMKKLRVEVVKSIIKDPWNNVLDIPNTDPHPDWFELGKHTDRKRLTDNALKILI
jgi:hypothetical protein